MFFSSIHHIIVLDLPDDLEYKHPPPLLYTEGLSWDYQPSDDLIEKLKYSVVEYYHTYKTTKLDKSNTPLYFMASGAGRGKSRNATELSNLLCSLFVNNQELKECLDNALIFNLSFENGTKIDTRVERSASTAISKKLLVLHRVSTTRL